MAFLEQHPPSKATIQRNVAKYQLNDNSLKFNKEDLGEEPQLEQQKIFKLFKKH